MTIDYLQIQVTMTINIYVLKGDLNGENRSGAFLFLSGIYTVKWKIFASPNFRVFASKHEGK